MAPDPTYPILLRKFWPKGQTFHNIFSFVFFFALIKQSNNKIKLALKAQVETDVHERTE